MTILPSQQLNTYFKRNNEIIWINESECAEHKIKAITICWTQSMGSNLKIGPAAVVLKAGPWKPDLVGACEPWFAAFQAGSRWVCQLGPQIFYLLLFFFLWLLFWSHLNCFRKKTFSVCQAGQGLRWRKGGFIGIGAAGSLLPSFKT